MQAQALGVIIQPLETWPQQRCHVWVRTKLKLVSGCLHPLENWENMYSEEVLNWAGV
jgi:hypothetical protein